MALFTVPASFLPSALARLTASHVPPADRRDVLAVLAAILGTLEPQSFTSGRDEAATAELLGPDPERWSRAIRLLEDTGAVARPGGHPRASHSGRLASFAIFSPRCGGFVCLDESRVDAADRSDRFLGWQRHHHAV